jgi:type I restriction enzyme S subunit
MKEKAVLPRNWAKARVGDLVDLVNGFAFKSSHWKATGLPIIRIQNLNDPNADHNYYNGMLPDKFLVNTGDLLFAWSGTPGTSFGAHIWQGGKAWLNQHIFKVLFNERYIEKRFLRLAINRNLSQYISEAHGAAGLAHITKAKIEASELLIPPLPEQQRIVAEIDKQFTRLDTAVAALSRAQVRLKKHRSSLLKAACEGSLVANEADLARTQARDYESGETLLTRILNERRLKWGRKTKYKEPAALSRSSVAGLPTGWTLASVEMLSILVQYGTSAKTGEVGEVPVLRMGNIVDGRLLCDKLKYLPASHDEFPELLLSPGDVLFNRTNSAELVGKTAVYHGNPSPCSFASYLVRIRMTEGYLPDFLAYYINSVFGRAWIASVVSQQVGQANVNASKLQALVVPVPPLAEQHRIVAEVKRQLSIIDKLQSSVATDLNRAECLRRSILKQTFEGNLVPQDPNDESAAVLLERIRSSKAVASRRPAPQTSGIGKRKSILPEATEEICKA